MASANRIRERYLHQLGLQRGGSGGAPTQQHQQQQHVVVISGLPSLPEDRATTTTDHHGQQQQHMLESHDFSIVSRLSHHTHETTTTSGASSVDGEEDDREGQENNNDPYQHPSISPNRLTSMALPCPMALKNVPLPPAKPTPSPTALSSSLPFTLSHWRNSSLSKSASVLLDSAEYDSVCSVGTCTTAESSLMLSKDWGALSHSNHPPPLHNLHPSKAHTNSAAASISSSTHGESSLSPVLSFTPGVYFQQARHNTTTPTIGSSSSFCSSQGQQLLLSQYSRAGVGVVGGGGGGCPTTSSLAHALNRFNIDSDCEASLASNSIIEDHNAMMDDNEDDTASRSSISSYRSAGTSTTGGGSSIKSQHSSSQHHPKKNKGVSKKPHHHHHHHQPKAHHHATVMDRATAHERILKVRNDHSMKMRANLAQSHRNHLAVAGNLSLAMAQEGSSSSGCSQGSSSGDGGGTTSTLPLHHVHHGSISSGCARPNHPPLTSSSDIDRSSDDKVCYDLGRTPTASNCCSDLHKLKELGLVIDVDGSSSMDMTSLLPVGVHISQNRPYHHPYPKQHPGFPSWRGAATAVRPLQVHPELVSIAPTPPSKLGWMTIASSTTISSSSTTEQVKASIEDATNDDFVTVSETSSLQHTNHSIEDVMEVAMTLSKLGSGGGGGGVVRNGSIPRFR